jgi:Protein of unknown function (DUF3037)
MIYREGLQNFEAELERFRKILGGGQPVGERELPALLARFRELVRPREGIFHFGSHGVLLAANPAAGLERVYAQFVVRTSKSNMPNGSESLENGHGYPGSGAKSGVTTV